MADPVREMNCRYRFEIVFIGFNCNYELILYDFLAAGIFKFKLLKLNRNDLCVSVVIVAKKNVSDPVRGMNIVIVLK